MFPCLLNDCYTIIYAYERLIEIDYKAVSWTVHDQQNELQSFEMILKLHTGIYCQKSCSWSACFHTTDKLLNSSPGSGPRPPIRTQSVPANQSVLHMCKGVILSPTNPQSLEVCRMDQVSGTDQTLTPTFSSGHGLVVWCPPGIDWQFSHQLKWTAPTRHMHQGRF